MLGANLHLGLRSKYFPGSPSGRDSWRSKSTALQQPSIQPFYALPNTDLRGPSRRSLELSRVRHVITLIARTPWRCLDRRTASVHIRDQFHQFHQADRVAKSAANVECLPRESLNVGLRKYERVHQVVNEKNVADLHAVAIEHD